MTTRNANKTKGFTLIELMIVVVVIAILAAIAYPSYREQVRKTRRSEAQAKLMEILQNQERFYTTNNTYTTDLTDLNYGTSGNVPTENGYYQISAAASCPSWKRICTG